MTVDILCGDPDHLSIEGLELGETFAIGVELARTHRSVVTGVKHDDYWPRPEVAEANRRASSRRKFEVGSGITDRERSAAHEVAASSNSSDISKLE
jgi:hypothetical protein